MLVTGTIPPLFLPVLRSILTGSANKLRTDIAEAELSFSDFSMLGVGDDARTRRWWRTHTLDAIRKIVIRRDGHGAVRTRLCVRCAAVMEDLIPTRGIRPWMLNMQRTCFCGAFWMLEQGG
jgi:mediator of RNA polymerase II transcription subunit 16